jgi:hypothetical protein
MDIAIDDAEMDIRGHYDVRGRLLMDEMSPGAQKISYTLEIKSPAPPDRIQELVGYAEKACHAMHTVKQPTLVEGTLLHNDVELEFEA